MTASGQKKREKKEETSPGNSVTAEVLLGGDKRSLPSGKRKDLQFNISRSVAKTRCIFIGSLAKSGYEIIFG